MDRHTAPSNAERPRAAHVSPRPSVLIAEHDTRSLDTMLTALAEAGYAVEYVKDGADALRMLKRMPPPLILVADEDLPRFGGFQLADLLSLTPGAIARYSAIVLTNSLGTALCPPMRCAPNTIFLEALVRPLRAAELLMALDLAACRLDGGIAPDVPGALNTGERAETPYPA
ncbi:MAG TPA: response regulator [Ktedonobacterales bacterium]|nr:response regulator [Ktedonobacterales bacterium]